jgi:hypothetical protein
MNWIIENPKYLIAGIVILILTIFLVIYLIRYFKSYDIEGDYFLHPMRFIACKINKKKSNEFEVKFKFNKQVLTVPQIDDLRQTHPNINNRIAKIIMTGEKGDLGDELNYIENGVTYSGIKLKMNYNLFARKDDIIVIVNSETKESIVFKKKID